MTPQNYLDHVITLIEKHAYYQPRVEGWADLKSDVLTRCKNAKTYAETYPLIQNLLGALDDHHSHFIPPDRENSGQVPLPSFPEGQAMGQYGYMKLPSASGDDSVMQEYAEKGQEIIRQVGKVEGWIIDLRENRGGNMWPMLVTAGPIIGEGTLGYFIGRDREQHVWGYRNGASWYDDESVYSVSNPATPIDEDYPVAVLVGEQTASSGEITLISILGRPNTRTFGQETRGIPTTNDVYPLHNDALLILTIGLTADRTRQMYKNGIVPDVICDVPLDEAKRWLSAC